MEHFYIKLTHPEARIIQPSRLGDAGYDLTSIDDCILSPFERKLISTGISISIPDGYAGLVVPRSGLAINHGITVLNSPGLIDSNYRGEVKVILVNLDKDRPYAIHAGDRIAQLVIMRNELPTFTVVDQLDRTRRGDNGFGSSGY